ncbi:MAG: VC0807 family protein [Deinococcales bacterium]
MSEVTKRQKNGLPKVVWDLIFTLLIPVALLAPSLSLGGIHFLGSELKDGKEVGFGVSDLIGTVPAYVIAALIPVVYIILDTLQTRAFNPITTVAASSALIGGALAFLQIDGWAYALKDSYRPIVFALIMGGSLVLGKPFFAIFLQFAMQDVTPERKPLLERLMSAKNVKLGLTQGTAIIAVESLIMATINFFVNLNIVTAKFGTKDFNGMVAQANSVMYLPSTIASFAAFGAAYFLVQRGLTKDFGEKAQLFDDSMWAALEAKNSDIESLRSP